MLNVRRPPAGWPIRIEAYEESRDAVYAEEVSPKSYLDFKPTKELYTGAVFEECIGEHLNGWAFAK
jgi:hypothetical protein